jgi:hypothetical protein
VGAVDEPDPIGFPTKHCSTAKKWASLASGPSDQAAKQSLTHFSIETRPRAKERLCSPCCHVIFGPEYCGIPSVWSPSFSSKYMKKIIHGHACLHHQRVAASEFQGNPGPDMQRLRAFQVQVTTVLCCYILGLMRSCQHKCSETPTDGPTISSPLLQCCSAVATPILSV